MAYSAPLTPNVNFSFQGMSAYTAPVTPNVNFAFLGVNQVSGFMPVRFGTPSYFRVSGFSPVRFGNVSVAQVGVTGFMPVNFGTPVTIGFYPVAGFMPVNFGAESLVHTVPGFMPVRFGVLSALLATGFNPSRFGTPVATQVLRTRAFRPCRFGVPAVAVAQSPSCAGFMATQFGRPTAIRLLGNGLNRRVYVYPNRGLNPVRFGTPTL